MSSQAAVWKLLVKSDYIESQRFVAKEQHKFRSEAGRGFGVHGRTDSISCLAVGRMTRVCSIVRAHFRRRIVLRKGRQMEKTKKVGGEKAGEGLR